MQLLISKKNNSMYTSGSVDSRGNKDTCSIYLIKQKPFSWLAHLSLASRASCSIRAFSCLTSANFCRCSWARRPTRLLGREAWYSCTAGVLAEINKRGN